jgi:hypothetical protein
MVMMTHNTDVADTWDREGESQDYFDLFSPRGYVSFPVKLTVRKETGRSTKASAEM